ncbi:hypothetical protein PCANB_002501 [Pneumocystis canis]|nr:hypothetical protein PCK1_002620 [Pneumocystis canis]KAG5438781.1 hypothetical protein PCANB_002501 [Pneumocystis canis]
MTLAYSDNEKLEITYVNGSDINQMIINESNETSACKFYYDVLNPTIKELESQNNDHIHFDALNEIAKSWYRFASLSPKGEAIFVNKLIEKLKGSNSELCHTFNLNLHLSSEEIPLKTGTTSLDEKSSTIFHDLPQTTRSPIAELLYIRWIEGLKNRWQSS